MIYKVYADGYLELGERLVRCALGRNGIVEIAAKREGDGGSPAGVWPLRRLLFRPDRIALVQSRLPAYVLGPSDGWCDAPQDSSYNKLVELPFPSSAERLWREDHLYDLIVVLGHNDDPVRPGAGSAIFLHVAAPDYTPTQGCVAIAQPDMEELLGICGPDDAIEISKQPRRSQP